MIPGGVAARRSAGVVRTAAIAAACLLCAVAGRSLWAADESPAATSSPPAGPASKERGLLALLAEGRNHLVAGRWSRAAEVLAQATATEPSNKEAFFLLGTALIHAGRLEEAASVLEPLVAANQEKASLKNNLAWIYLKSTDSKVRNIEKALRYAREAILLDPNDPNIWGTMADAHYAAGEYELALRCAKTTVYLATVRGTGERWQHWELIRRCARAAGVVEQQQIAP